MGELPIGWELKTLEEIVVDEYGLVDGPFGSNLRASEYTEFGVPVIRGSNLSLGTSYFVDNEFVFVSEAKAEELARSNCFAEDIVFTKKGTLGQTGIIPKNHYFEKFVLSSNQMKMTVDKSIADPYFVYYYVSSSASVEKIKRDAESTGVPKTNLAYLRTFPITLPPLDEQRAIADILGSLDDKIEANRRQNETLEATARAIFKSWFVDFDPVHAKANGEVPIVIDTETADLFPDSFEDSELGMIPSGWRVGTLGEIAENPRRGIQPEDLPENTLYVGLEHIPRESLALSEWGLAEDVNSNKYQFNDGEILFGKLRPYFHKVVVAPIDGICSTDILVISSIEDIFYGLAVMYLSSTSVIEYATRISTGTRMPRANWKNLSQYPIVLPSYELLEIYNATIFPILDQICQSVHQSRTLAETRDALLPKLVSGELRVGELE